MTTSTTTEKQWETDLSRYARWFKEPKPSAWVGHLFSFSRVLETWLTSPPNHQIFAKAYWLRLWVDDFLKYAIEDDYVDLNPSCAIATKILPKLIRSAAWLEPLRGLSEATRKLSENRLPSSSSPTRRLPPGTSGAAASTSRPLSSTPRTSRNLSN